MQRFAWIAAVVALVALSACRGSSSAGSSSVSRSAYVTPSAVSPVSAASPTQPVTPAVAPRTKGPATTSCQNGWVTPPSDSPLATQPLGIIRRTMGVAGPLVVVDMRYFTGPESPTYDSVGEKAKGYLAVVQRWYIKLYAKDDLSFQGRFLVESRTFGRGLSAVAPYDTTGWSSPDWHGFQFNSSDTSPRMVPGLPGEWSGVEYDFVKGGAGLTFPGLPKEVVGCLKGT